MNKTDKVTDGIIKDELEKRKNFEAAMKELEAFNEKLIKKYGLRLSSYMQPVITLVIAETK
jgi:hypothetical protein